MTFIRWWTVAVVATVLLQCSILLLTSPEPWQLAVGAGSGALFLAAWFGFGWRCGDDTTGSLVFVAITVIFAGAVAFANPSLAIVQCIAFPLAWTRLSRARDAIIASTAIAVSVGVGLFFSTDDLSQAVAIEAISLAFAIALGLWITSIANQSTERQKLLDELQATQNKLATLSRDAGATGERERLAREIHDTIAQDLTGLVMLAQRASRELAAGTLEPAHIDVLEENARLALAETRALVASSAPPGLDDGLAPALERLGARFERETGVAVSVETDAAASVDRDTEVVLLRCAQEGLSNVRKHANARAITLTLAGSTLRVVDDGAGFDTTAPTPGYGLAGMRERLALVGGTVQISTGSTGTTLEVVVPA